MKIYVAGRTNNTAEVKHVQKVCRVAGHEITHDWASVVEEVGGAARDDVVTPERQRTFAEADMLGVCDADVVILVASPGLCGSLIEVGAALAMGKKVWILGEPERHSIFFHMLGVTKLVSEVQLNRELLMLSQ